MSSVAIQSFFVSAMTNLHATPIAAASLALTVHLFCTAGGVLIGGEISDRTKRHDIVAAVVFVFSALITACIAWFDMGLELTDIARDIVKRPFILVGFSAFVLLTPLALTSFNRAIKALGARRWQLLHRAVYLVAGLAVFIGRLNSADKGCRRHFMAHGLKSAQKLVFLPFSTWWGSFLLAVPSWPLGLMSKKNNTYAPR